MIKLPQCIQRLRDFYLLLLFFKFQVLHIRTLYLHQVSIYNAKGLFRGAGDKIAVSDNCNIIICNEDGNDFHLFLQSESSSSLLFY